MKELAKCGWLESNESTPVLILTQVPGLALLACFSFLAFLGFQVLAFLIKMKIRHVFFESIIGCCVGKWDYACGC